MFSKVFKIFGLSIDSLFPLVSTDWAAAREPINKERLESNPILSEQESKAEDDQVKCILLVFIFPH